MTSNVARVTFRILRPNAHRVTGRTVSRTPDAPAESRIDIALSVSATSFPPASLRRTPLRPLAPPGTCARPGSSWKQPRLAAERAPASAHPPPGLLDLLGYGVHAPLPRGSMTIPSDQHHGPNAGARERNGQGGGKLGHCRGHDSDTGPRHTLSRRILPHGRPHLSSSRPRVVKRS